jgi:hypothetical protein
VAKLQSISYNLYLYTGKPCYWEAKPDQPISCFMKFRRIFGRHHDIPLYSVCMPGEKIKGKRTDSFSKVFSHWNDTQYLLQILLENEERLNGAGDQTVSVDSNLDKILNESARFESQLRKIENREAGYENILLTGLFKPLLKKVYVLQLKDLLPEYQEFSTLRIYALKLKGIFFITAGSVRFSNQSEHELDDDVKWKLNEVCHFFKKKLVFDPWGLDENKF